METRAVPPFAPADARAQWAKGLLIATAVVAVVGIGSGLLQMDLLSRAAGGDVSEVEAAANDSRQALIGMLQVFSYLGTATAFLMWIHRAHRNLGSLGGRKLKYSPRWAVGGFFVPFLNLARPYQVMREVWHGSDPSGLARDLSDTGPTRREQEAAPPLVTGWWTLFLLSGLVGNLVMRQGLAPEHTLEHLQRESLLLVLSDALDVPSAILALLVVDRITRWQGQRHLATQLPNTAGAPADPNAAPIA